MLTESPIKYCSGNHLSAATKLSEDMSVIINMAGSLSTRQIGVKKKKKTRLFLNFNFIHIATNKSY